MVNQHAIRFLSNRLQVNRHYNQDLIPSQTLQQVALLGVVELLKGFDDVLVRDSYQLMAMIITVLCLVLIPSDLKGALGNLQASSDVTRVRGYLTRYQLNRFDVKYASSVLLITRDSSTDAASDNLLDLVPIVRFVDETIVTDSTGYLRLQLLWEIHSVGDCNNQEA